MDARILEKILHDFGTMTVEEYRDLHAQAIERSKQIEDTILLDDHQNVTVNCVSLNPITVRIDTGTLATYDSIVNSVYITCNSIIATKPEGGDSWLKAA